MLDMRAVRLEIFRRTRSHTYTCLMYGGSWVFGFKNCKCDSGNKKQYLNDLILEDMIMKGQTDVR